MKKIRTTYIILLFIIINVIISNPSINYSFDLTKNKKNTLSPSSEKILKLIDDDMYFKVFLAGDLNEEFNEMSKNIENILLNIQKYNKKIQFKFIDPQSEKTHKNEIERKGLVTIDVYRKDKKITIEQIIPSCIIYYKNKEYILNFLEYSNNINKMKKTEINNAIKDSEYKIIKKIKKIVTNNKYNIAFLQGHGELDTAETKIIYNELIKNYNVEYFNILEADISILNKTESTGINITASQKNNEIIKNQIQKLKNYKILIIAQPTKKFNIIEKFIIEQYFLNGGKIIWLLEGVSLEKTESTSATTIYNKLDLGLNDMLKNYGVKVNHDLILDSICDIVNKAGARWPYQPILLPNNNNILTKNGNPISTYLISSIDTFKTKNDKKIILSSSESSNKIEARNSFITNNYPKYKYKNIICGVLIEGHFQAFLNKEKFKNNIDLNIKNEIIDNKMIVVSDGSLIHNNLMNYGNKEFFNKCIDYLSDDLHLIELKNKNLKVNYLDKEKILNKRKWQVISTITPILILIIFSIIFNIIRKRKFQYV